MKRLLVCAFLMGVMTLSTTSHASLSFDTLFPETAYKQLHDTVLQLWSDLTLLHDARTSDVQKRDLYDLVSGQIVRIGHLIEHMQMKSHTLNNHDIAYVESVAQGLSDKFSDFLSHKHVQPLWQNILKGFAALLGD